MHFGEYTSTWRHDQSCHLSQLLLEPKLHRPCDVFDARLQNCAYNMPASFSIAVRQKKTLGAVRAGFPVLFSGDCDLEFQFPVEVDVDGTCGKRCATPVHERILEWVDITEGTLDGTEPRELIMSSSLQRVNLEPLDQNPFGGVETTLFPERNGS